MRDFRIVENFKRPYLGLTDLKCNEDLIARRHIYNQYPLMYHPGLCQRLDTLCGRYVLYCTWSSPTSCLQGLSGPLAAFSCTLVRGYLPVMYHPDA